MANIARSIVLSAFGIACLVVLLGAQKITQKGQQRNITARVVAAATNGVAAVKLQPQQNQTQQIVIINNGQVKEGLCQITRPAAGYSSIAQFEGQWYRRYRSRLEPNEPQLKCSHNRYVYLGNGSLINMVAKQFTSNNKWLKQNETNLLNLTDQSTWINTQSEWQSRILFFDPKLGVAVVYACLSSPIETHQNIASLYTRSPDTNLTESYLNATFDIFRQNGIHDILPLLPVDHTVCSDENLPKPTHLVVNLQSNTTNLLSGNTTERTRAISISSKTVFNNGQEKEGQCQPTKRAANYSSIAQFEGLWFIRFQSRGRPREPLLKCSYSQYEYKGNFTLFNLVSKQSSANSQWTFLNETNQLNGNDTSTWTSTLSATTTRVLYLDTNLGIAVIYSCLPTTNGHRNSGTLLSRSASTVLAKDYLDKVLEVFSTNGILDVLPLHPVDQDVCSGEKMPKSTHHPDGRRIEVEQQQSSIMLTAEASQQSSTCNCTCAKGKL